jgi:hypothetical protein
VAAPRRPANSAPQAVKNAKVIDLRSMHGPKKALRIL